MADNFYSRYPVTGGGVTSLNGLTGALTLVGGTGITITPSGSTITISSTGLMAAITSINGDTTSAQTLSVGTAGTDFAITNPGGGSHIFNLPTASAVNRGALSSADWTTFNSKQVAGNYITALTGDGTATGPGSVAFTLATVNGNVGTFGTATQVGTFTVNAKGLITSASNTSIQIAESQVTNLVSDLAGKQPVGNYITALTGDVTATGPGSVAASLTATSNSTLVTLSSLVLPINQTTGNLPQGRGGTGFNAYADGQLLIGNSLGGGLSLSTLTAGTGVSIVNGHGSITINAAGSGGTVTSVALADSTGLFNITGSPVTTSGTLTLASFQSQAANTFFAAPNGASGAPTFRLIVAADVPTLNQNTTGTASNITATSNSTLTTLSALSLPATQLTGTLQAAQEPAHTGDVTNTAGSLVLSLVATTNSTLTTLSALSLPGSQVTGNISGNAANVTGVVAIANGGTGQSTKTAAFDALQPMTTGGDLIYGGTAGTGTRLANGSAGQVLTSGGTTVAPTWQTPTTGTVTSVSVVSTNGLAGTSSGGATPALTLSTTITGVLKGNGTAISAAVAGTDYVIPSGSITGTASNITATSNSTLTTLSALSLPYSQITGAPAAITALTGDGTATGPGSVPFTLATVNGNVGSFGSSTSIPSFTVNAKGLITAASSNVVIAPAGTLSGTTLNSTVVSSSLTSLGTITTGVWNGTTIAVANGGTGQTTYTDGQLLIGNSSTNGLTKSTLTAGSNITITNGNGSISIAASSSALPKYNYTAQSTTYNAVVGDYVFASGASFTITLPTAVGQAGNSIIIQHGGTSITQVYTLNTTSAQTIGGVASGSYALFTNSETLTVFSDGANWIIDEHKTITGWTTYTPTFTGFGTVTTQTCRWRRNGDSIDVDIQFVAGTTTATEARVSIPTTSDAGYPTLQWVGLFGISINSAASFAFTIEASKAYVTMTDQGGATNGLAKINGNILTAGTTISGFVRGLKITNWQP